MIAVFINSAGIRLGHHRVSDVCRLIHFGGGYFVRTDEEAVLDDGGRGTVFVGTEMHVYDAIDHFEPTHNFNRKPTK